MTELRGLLSRLLRYLMPWRKADGQESATSGEVGETERDREIDRDRQRQRQRDRELAASNWALTS